MKYKPEKLSLGQMDELYASFIASGIPDDELGGKLGRHLEDGDFRLSKLKFDNSPASFMLWNFLLTEEERLNREKDDGKYIIATMKDLGTVPVMIYSLPDTIAFYPDGAWWVPCIMEMSAGLLKVADSLGIDESFCPVRAMLGAFLTDSHFPRPDQIICSTGAVCDDFSAIAQRLNGMGFPITWWEIPHRRMPGSNEAEVTLEDGTTVPDQLLVFVRDELERVKKSVETTTGHNLSDDMLREGIAYANSLRSTLNELRCLVFTAPVAPLPGLELLIAEMLIIHYCSDKNHVKVVLEKLLDEVKTRVAEGTGVLPENSVKVFWINPVADILGMNLFEDLGCRLCGTDFMFCHSLNHIPENIPPIDALARTALADPMVGSSRQRAERICSDIEQYGSEGVIISRIPGASHCAFEGEIIHDMVTEKLGIPVVEIEVPPLIDSYSPVMRNRLQALVETIISRRV